MVKRFLSKILVLALAVSCFVPLGIGSEVHAATSFKDTEKHWAKDYIAKAVEKGIVNGFEDGTFRPDEPVTRAQFVAMVNRAIGNTGEKSINFKDVSSGEWYYKDVAKAVSAAYVSGYETGDFRPDNSITRAEAAVIISRIVPTYGQSKDLSAFSDASAIRSNVSWAEDALSKAVGKGYIGDYGDGSLHATEVLTRAQAAKIITDITEKETIVTADTTVSQSGTELSNRIYSNVVTVSSALASGNASLSNVVVLGTLTVSGGSSSSGVVVKNSRIAEATVSRSGDTVRFEMSGETSVPTLNSHGSTILVSDNLSSGAAGASTLNVGASSDASLRGKFQTVNTVGAAAKITVDSGSVNSLNVEGKDSEITVAGKGSIGIANANASCKFLGTGTIGLLNVNSSGVSYETKPTSVVNKNGYSVNGSTAGTADSWIYSQEPEPKDTNIKIDSAIEITFNDILTLADGKSSTSANVGKYISLNRNSKSGTSVAFSVRAADSTSKKRTTLTITPSKDLAEDTRYYITIDEGAFLNSSGEKNAEISYYFDTGDEDSIVGVYRTSPSSGATGVSVTADIVITFDERMTLVSGSDTYKNLKSDVRISTSKSGSTLSYTPDLTNKTVSSKSRSVLTLDPDSSLSYNTTYYVTIDSGVFQNSDGDKNEKIQFSFTTASQNGSTTNNGAISSVTAGGRTLSDTASSNVEVAATGNIVINFSTTVKNSSKNTLTASDVTKGIIFKRENANGTDVSFTPGVSTSSITLAYSKLEDGVYYLEIPKNTFYDANNNVIAGKSYSFTVGKEKPVLSSLTTSVDVTGASATFSAKANVAGTLYAVLVSGSGGTTPTADQVYKAVTTTNNSLTNQVAAKSMSVAAGGEGTLKYTDLTIGETYTLYAILWTSSTQISDVNIKTFVMKESVADVSVERVTLGTQTISENSKTYSFALGTFSDDAAIDSMSLTIVANDSSATIDIADSSFTSNTTSKTGQVSGKIKLQAGTGTIRFTVKNGTAAEGNEASETYTINYSCKVPAKLSLDTASLSLKANGVAGTITVTNSGDGKITASSNNTAVATVTENTTGGTFTVTPVSAGTCTITISAPATDAYTAPTSVVCTVSVSAAS